jgi:hypothetical protein
MIVKHKLKNLISIVERWFDTDNDNDMSQYKCKFFCQRGSGRKFNNNFFIEEKKYTLINDLTIEYDDIFNNFAKNTKYEIRRILKENPSYEVNNISIDSFIEYYNIFAKSKNLDLMNKVRISKYPADNLKFLSAYLNDELLVIQVYLTDSKNIARLLYSVSHMHICDDKKKRNNIGYLNRYLHGEAMQYFQVLGYLKYDWGGYGNDESNYELAGIDKFKKSFGGELSAIYDYYSIPYFILLKIKSFI